MKNLYYRISNAFKIGVWAFRNPQTINQVNFKMLSDILELILKVAKESRPMMCKIACVHPETNEQLDIVSIWAGAGLGADPYKRITELKRETELLKAQLLDNVKSNPEPPQKEEPLQ